MKYAALKFNSTNIGDEIQSIAAQRFLPEIDYYIFREQLSKFQSEEKVKLIMNSWYMWRPQKFPPSECIDPLLVSMYFSPDCRKRILNAKTMDFFRSHGPVGCRDLSTKKWLDDKGIPAYFSACLTSTLIPNPSLRNRFPNDYILCVDCSDSIVDYVRRNTGYPVYSFGKLFSPYIESEDRMKLAKAVLYMYHNAHCVITTNFHTAFPCLAFETKVCLIEREHVASYEVGRFEGLEDFFIMLKEEDFLKGQYDFNKPKDNPIKYMYYRDQLIEKCRLFTGFDSQKPTLDDDFEPLHIVLSIISENHNNVRRVMYWAERSELIYMLIMKLFSGKDRHDIKNKNYMPLLDFIFKDHK